jgi:hypothetical protein
VSEPINQEAIAAKGAEIEAAEWHLPKKFRLQSELLALEPEELKKRDPEMAALWIKIQAQEKQWAAAANSVSGNPSPQDIHRARAVQRAEELRNDIERLKSQIGAALVSGEDVDIAELQGAVLALRFKRAENLALIGRFDLAAQETPDPQYRDHYLSILEAVFNESENCTCEPHRGSGEHTNISIPQTFIKEEIWSLRHASMAFLIRCNGCGDARVTTELPAHLAEQRSHRSRAMQIAKGLSIAKAAEELRSQNHTTAQLIGGAK